MTTATSVVLAAIAGGGMIAVLLGVMVGGGIALLFFGMQRVLDAPSTSVVKRLDQVVNISLPTEQQSRRGPRSRRFGNPANNRGNTSSSAIKLARELARADLKITVGEFWVISAVAASVGALVGFALPVSGHFLLGFLMLVGGLYAPRWWIRRRKRLRQRSFNGQLADVINLMSGALRSGYSLLQSMELVAREGPQPVAMEFDRVVREVGLGLSPEEALANLVERMQSEDLELLVTAINVQREVGGNLVEVMETIAVTIRERVKLIGSIGVLTSQQQASGYIIAALPIGLALILGIINPDYMLGIFTSTRFLGWTLLGCSLTSIGMGFLIIRQIVNIKV